MVHTKISRMSQVPKRMWSWKKRNQVAKRMDVLQNQICETDLVACAKRLSRKLHRLFKLHRKHQFARYNDLRIKKICPEELLHLHLTLGFESECIECGDQLMNNQCISCWYYDGIESGAHTLGSTKTIDFMTFHF